jgi:hypothetical protein
MPYEHSEGVDAHDAVEVVFVDVHERKRLVEPGVVEHDVEPTETVDGLLNRLSHLLPFRDIERHGDRLLALLAQTVRNGFGLYAIDVRDHDRRAFLS